VSNDVINTTTASAPFTALDAELLAGAGPAGQDIYRERVQVTGAILAEIARVINASVVGTEYALVTRNIEQQGTIAAFMASTNGTVSSGTALATVQSIAYLFHTAGSTKTIKIVRIDISDNTGNNGALNVRGAFITAENGAPGGTSQTINGVNQADTAEGTDTFRTGATGEPTRVTGDLITFAMAAGPSSPAGTSTLVWEAGSAAKAITLRAGVAEGFEIRSVISNAFATADQIAVTYYWTEE
jgi:hypothetical protein